MVTQSTKEVRIPILLIILGAIAVLFSLLSSTLAFAGMGIIFLIVGSIVYLRKTISGIVVLVLFVSVAIISSGCTVKVPMVPDVGKIGIEKKMPVEAGLLITEETKNYIFKGNPESFTGGGRPHEFPLGAALEQASIYTFSQVFDKVNLVRTSQEAQKYKIFIEPKIEDFHFRYNQLSYAGFAVAVISKIKVHVTLGSGETKVWGKSIESPEQKKGPWFFNPGYEKEVGESASDALVFALRQFALEIYKDASIREFIEKQ